ncbi:MAG: hypothetical protein LUG99_10985 [Lachnospiraceae bacterium]|nr:hypothetical protein [Lachnospiraceae bacterium]
MTFRLPKDIIRIKCQSCETITELHESDFEYVETSREREMGTDVTYRYDADFTCNNCNNGIKVCYQMFEYPEGVFNEVEPSCLGGEILD